MKRNGVTKKAEQPLYIQIEQQIIDSIRQGVLKPHQRVKGTRQAAKELNVNRQTVADAYERLIANGWLYTKGNEGTFVGEHTGQILPAVPVPPANFEFNEFYYAIGHEEAERRQWLVKFDEGFPDPQLAPVKELTTAYKRIFTQALRLRRTDLAYSEIEHREVLSHLNRLIYQYRTMKLDERHLCFIFGQQMALYLVAQTLLHKGDHVAVENPGNFRAWQVLQAAGATLHPVPVDSEGIDTDSLDRLCRHHSIKAVYVSPNCQNPTTVEMSTARREHLLHLAIEYGFAVIEEDDDYEFRYTLEKTPPLISGRKDDHIIYISSISKMLPPLHFICFVAGPAPFIKSLKALWASVGQQGDIILEQALIELIKDGMLSRFARKSTNVYKQKRDKTSELLDNYLHGKVHYINPPGGLSFWLKFDKNVSVEQIRQQLKERGIYVPATSPYFLNSPLEPALRLGFASLGLSQMEAAIKDLASLL